MEYFLFEALSPKLFHYNERVCIIIKCLNIYIQINLADKNKYI